MNKELNINRGDIFFYDFGDNKGSIQSGKRPVLVVQADNFNQNAPTIIVAAITIENDLVRSNSYNKQDFPNFKTPKSID